MKKKVIISAVVIAVILLLSIPALINDISLGSFAHQLYTYPLPQKTELIEHKEVCGNLIGGSGMDFFACILIKSGLTSEELKEYYDSIDFTTPKYEPYLHYVRDDVLPATGYVFVSYYNENAVIHFDTLKDKNDFSNYYVVMIYDLGYSPDLDLRGY
jgi:hypothetical protein